MSSDKNDNNITLKVVLVGDSGVGKTCIIQRFSNDTYDDQTESTIASAYTYKMLEFKDFNKSISFDIWDTAGQELYRSLAKNFYLNAAIGILVYDIRRKESFESIKTFWYEELKNSGEENMIFGIAGNKCDLFNEEEVKESEVKEFAKKIGAIFQLTSAQDNIGIKELFNDLGTKYLESHGAEGGSSKPKGDKLEGEKKENTQQEKKKRKFC